MISDSTNKIMYLGNGVSTEFIYPFKVTKVEDIRLIKISPTGIESAVTRDYYVEMLTSVVHYPGWPPNQEEPVNDRPVPLPAGWKLLIYREVDYVQEVALFEQYPFKTIENMIDKTTMQVQQIREDNRRALKLSITNMDSDGVDMTLPAPTPLQSFRWDVSAKKLELTLDPATVLPLAEQMRNIAIANAEIAVANAEIAVSSKDAAGVSEKNALQSEGNAAYWANIAEEIGAGTGFIKSDGSVPMKEYYTPAVGQDVATQYSVEKTIEENHFVKADGSVAMFDGYIPALNQDVTTKKYVDFVIANAQLGKFCVNEGNTANGYADLIDSSISGTLSFKIGDTYPDIKATSSIGNTFACYGVKDVSISGKTGLLYAVLDKSTSVVSLTNNIYIQNNEPTVRFINNLTVSHGNPSISTDGIYTGGAMMMSRSNIPYKSIGANKWEYTTKFKFETKTTNATLWGCFSSCSSPLIVLENAVNFKVYLPSSPSAWGVGNIYVSDFNPTVGIWYWIKLKFTGTDYQFGYSTNGISYTWKTIITSTALTVFSDTPTIGNYYANLTTYAFKGNIDIKESSFSINDQIVWSNKTTIFESDIWVDTSSLPNISYKYSNGIWEECECVPLGIVVLDDGVVSEVINFPYNSGLGKVAVVSGSITNGGVIPLPAGYTQDQCVFMVSPRDCTATSGAIQCYVSANRVVTSLVGVTNMSANYIIIGVK